MASVHSIQASPEATGPRHIVIVESGEPGPIKDTISGIMGIVDALYGPMFDDLPDEACQMVIAYLKMNIMRPLPVFISGAQWTLSWLTPGSEPDIGFSPTRANTSPVPPAADATL